MTLRVVTLSASSIRGINNFGDELLTEMFGGWIAAAAERASVHHVAIGHLGRMDASSRQALGAADLLLFTGGGYFADGYGSWGKRQLRSLRNRAVYGSVFQSTRRRGVPHAVLGLEVGPLDNPLYRRTVRSILRTAEKVVVRNEQSRVNAERLCGELVPVSMQLDAALVAGDFYLSEDPPGDGSVNVGIHTKDPPDSGPGDAAIVRLVRQVMAEAHGSRPVSLRFIHDQRKRGRHPEGARQAELYFRKRFPELEVIPYTDPRSTVAAVAEMDLVVTSKLHVGIVARGLGVPALATGAHAKIRRFYETIGEPESCGPPEVLLRRGIPDRVLRSVRGDRRTRLPVDSRARNSAAANRNQVEDLISSVTRGPGIAKILESVVPPSQKKGEK